MICPTWLDNLYAHVFIVSTFVICAQSDVPRPRGVSLSKAPLYSPTKEFTCFDGTASIPFSYVNDDYCDCFDGSDEPGTSACLNGVFHCINAGHRAENLPSSRVNDGVCDCCDGTDEYADETKQCPNICADLGKEAKAESLRLAELHKAGSEVKKDLIQKGNKKRHEMSEQLAQLEKDKAEAEDMKTERENLKNEIEERENDALKVYREAEEKERERKLEEERQANQKEAEETFDKYDSNKDGILSVDEFKVINAADKDKNGEVDEFELNYFLSDSAAVDKETFVTTTWPLLKPLLMMEQGMFKREVEPEGEVEHEDEDLADNEDHEGDGDTEDLGADDENFGDDLPEDTHNEPETDHHETSSKYDDETQKLVDQANEARKQVLEAERTIREIDSSIRNIQQNLEKDYGPNQEFATLENQCLDYEDKEYTYTLCLFQKVTQKSKNGGHDVGLGSWGEWAGGDNPYSKMKYTNGVTCWNGPNRMTIVNLNCGLETEITSVTEPYRCEYKMELSTPAACEESYLPPHLISHDEL